MRTGVFQDASRSAYGALKDGGANRASPPLGLFPHVRLLGLPEEARDLRVALRVTVAALHILVSPLSGSILIGGQSADGA
jgi:hypothetical protein